LIHAPRRWAQDLFFQPIVRQLMVDSI
jgi:hypothetical protein